MREGDLWITYSTSTSTQSNRLLRNSVSPQRSSLTSSYLAAPITVVRGTSLPWNLVWQGESGIERMNYTFNERFIYSANLLFKSSAAGVDIKGSFSRKSHNFFINFPSSLRRYVILHSASTLFKPNGCCRTVYKLRYAAFSDLQSMNCLHCTISLPLLIWLFQFRDMNKFSVVERNESIRTLMVGSLILKESVKTPN